MKKNFAYNININQKAAFEIFGNTLDHTDHIILDYCMKHIGYGFSKNIIKREDGAEFVYINSKYILEQNPILKLSQNSVSERLYKLVKNKALDRMKTSSNNCYYRITEKTKGLIFEPTQKSNNLHEKQRSPFTENKEAPSRKTSNYYNTLDNNTHISMPDDISISNHQELRNKILKYFGFSPESSKHHRQTVLVQQCINIQKFNKQLDYFEEQVNSYIKFKKLSEQTVHSFYKWIGSLSEHFEDGAWNQENWTAKLKKHSEKSENKAVYKKPKVLKPHDYLSK